MKNSETKNIQSHSGNTVLCDGFLIPMSDFVLQIDKLRPCDLGQDFSSWNLSKLITIKNYAKFIKQPLKLEMFVPCVDGSPIEYFELKKTGGKFCQVGSKIEKEAKGKILFEDFELISETDETWLFKINGNFPRIVGKKLTIESLRIFKDKIKLSQSALNAIFG